jgi:tRNA (guanine37-N1)-methyltransferase
MRNFMIGLKVSKKDTNRIRRILMKNNLLNVHFKIKRSSDHVYLPLHTTLKDSKLHEMGLSRRNLVEIDFEELIQRPKSLKEYLQGKISMEKVIELKKSFDIIGNVVILEIPDDLADEKHLIAEAALKVTKRKSVYRKKSEIKGVNRTRELEHLAGDDSSETIHQEFGSRLKLDVRKVYFSPRLATERKRIVDQVQDGETIIDMFTGVGPFAVAIARKHEVKIYAIDINPEAISYLKENMKINRVYGKINPILGDVIKVLDHFNVQADRIIMNLPGSAQEFLPLAVEHLKPGGVLHYYQFSSDFDEPVKNVKTAASLRRVEILDKRRVKSRSPGVWHVGIDAKIC